MLLERCIGIWSTWFPGLKLHDGLSELLGTAAMWWLQATSGVYLAYVQPAIAPALGKH